MVRRGARASGGADTVNCGTRASNGLVLGIAEVSNVNFFSDDNILLTEGKTASPATITSGNLTTLVPNEILFGACAGYTGTSTNAMNSPFTVAGTNSISETTGYDVVTTVTTYTMACNQASNTNQSWMIGLSALRPANGTVSPPSGIRHKAIVE